MSDTSEPVEAPPKGAPDRNLAMELVRVTEAGAMAAGRWIGRGQKEGADKAAVDAMRVMLDTVSMDGVVVIGEGEKDEAPMLYNGERVGNGQPPGVDVAVDPLEGTRLTALGMPNAISVVAVAERGTMFFPGAAVYMDKIAAGPELCDEIDIEAPPAENIRRVAKAKGTTPEGVSVVVLDRDRHQDLIRDLREAGARVFLITDGDVAPSIAAAQERTGVDLLMGVGGTPEGVISAAALKCLGGGMQGKLWPRNDEERRALVDTGYDLARVLSTDDLVGGQDVFVAATGVTNGALLKGVRYTAAGRGHRVDRHAFALRHGPQDRSPPRVREADEVLEHRLSLRTTGGRLRRLRLQGPGMPTVSQRHDDDRHAHDQGDRVRHDQRGVADGDAVRHPEREPDEQHEQVGDRDVVGRTPMKDAADLENGRERHDHAPRAGRHRQGRRRHAAPPTSDNRYTPFDTFVTVPSFAAWASDASRFFRMSRCMNGSR